MIVVLNFIARTLIGWPIVSRMNGYLDRPIALVRIVFQLNFIHHKVKVDVVDA